MTRTPIHSIGQCTYTTSCGKEVVYFYRNIETWKNIKLIIMVSRMGRKNKVDERQGWGTFPDIHFRFF
jgi:hypothetical protein